MPAAARFDLRMDPYSPLLLVERRRLSSLVW
jgi:hypothetical protein